MKLVINKLCSSCNKDFELKDVQHSGMIRASIANFEDCPHCGERNDHWIKVTWPKFYEEGGRHERSRSRDQSHATDNKQA